MLASTYESFLCFAIRSLCKTAKNYVVFSAKWRIDKKYKSGYNLIQKIQLVCYWSTFVSFRQDL